MIEFLLNDQPVCIESAQPDLTVLDYLRDQRRLCGTKEGCASGDCGACRAVMVENRDGALHYSNFNSCITFLGALHGKQLITVEHLKSQGDLHPVQQSMVSHHGSQCGFCTPGFVMSLFALYHAGKTNGADQDKLTEEYLAGNLCRCTGYQPILTAAKESLRAPRYDRFTDGSSETITLLESIAKKRSVGNSGFHRPRTGKQVADLLSQWPDAHLLCGGTDLALEVTQQLKSLDQIIYLGDVSELKRIKARKKEYEIGAAVNLVDLDGLVANEYPDLSAMLKRFGSRQVRNQGTVGGNIANASPIGDLPPVFMALDAGLKLSSGKGARTIAMEEFFLDYRRPDLRTGEFVHSILLPRPRTGHQLKIFKVSKRIDDDISAVLMAVNIELVKDRVKTVRIAFGGMAATPKRATACEQALLGNILNPTTVVQAQQALAEDFQPIDDVRASAAYRMQVSQNLIDRLYLELTVPGLAVRITDHD